MLARLAEDLALFLVRAATMIFFHLAAVAFFLRPLLRSLGAVVPRSTRAH